MILSAEIRYDFLPDLWTIYFHLITSVPDQETELHHSNCITGHSNGSINHDSFCHFITKWLHGTLL
jgi:hypothetical protein